MPDSTDPDLPSRAPAVLPEASARDMSRRQMLVAAGTGAAALVGQGAGAPVATAATFSPGASVPAGFYPFQIGRSRCVALSDGALDFPTSFYGVNAPPDELKAEFAAHFLPTDLVHNQTTCLYVNTGRHKVLIDTGLEHDLAQKGGSLRAQLQGSGHLVDNLKARSGPNRTFRPPWASTRPWWSGRCPS